MFSYSHLLRRSRKTFRQHQRFLSHSLK